MAGEEQVKGALLKKHYYENCPGCKVEQLKELQKGFPIKQLVSVGVVVLCSGKSLFGCEKIPIYSFLLLEI